MIVATFRPTALARRTALAARRAARLVRGVGTSLHHRCVAIAAAVATATTTTALARHALGGLALLGRRWRGDNRVDGDGGITTGLRARLAGFARLVAARTITATATTIA